MAYVQMSGSSKPRFKPTLARNLPTDTLVEICMMLNAPLARKDYRSLAGKIGLNWYQVGCLMLHVLVGIILNDIAFSGLSFIGV